MKIDTPRLHATAVAVEGRAALLLGRAGVGKSELALSMMALGAGLIADDQVLLAEGDGAVIASCPPTIRGRIEVRGLGILAAEPAAPAPVALVVDLDSREEQRLPPWRTATLLGQSVALLHGFDSPHFAAALMLYLKGGRTD